MPELSEEAFKRSPCGKIKPQFGSTTSTTNVSTATPTLTPEQQQMIKAQTDFFTGTIAPTYENAVGGATNVYNNTSPSVQGAAQNYSQIAGQAQNVLGQTGESALRSGISGLQNVNNPEYVKQQLAAVLNPAQAQYEQNMVRQGAMFGGAGQIGSQRQAIADRQLAGMNQAIQQQGAAQVMNQLNAQQLAANQSLAGFGQQGLTGAQAAGANQVNAAMAPQDLYNKYASVIFGTPAASYSPNFAGTQTINQSGSGTQSQSGFNLSSAATPFIGAGLTALSDSRAKREIKLIGKKNEIKIYSFKYLTDDTTWVGVMAQDVKDTHPDCVVMGDDGFYRVHYDKLGLRMMTLEEFKEEE
jgi:hypothetical protein